MLDTPVLLIVFNRPDPSAKVFAAIRQARPQRLFVAADGPRENRPGESDLCAQVRNIVTAVDWTCECKTLFQPNNLGCGRAVSTAITWFFDNVERGIILEDDTVPEPSFFPFCTTMLDRYARDERIMHICGSNFQRGKTWGPAPYYLSYYSMIWGWATWRRAWKKYDFELAEYPGYEHDLSVLNSYLSEPEKKYWKELFDIMHYGERKGLIDNGGAKETVGTGFQSVQDSDRLKTGPHESRIGGAAGNYRIDTWDYQWIYTCWRHKGLSITPNRNLITNIGFGDNATHTTHLSNVARLKTAAICGYEAAQPVHHYPAADQRLFHMYFSPPVTMVDRLRDLACKVLPAGVQQRLREFKKRIMKRGAA